MRTCGMRVLFVAAVFFLAYCLYGQQKYALVSGNAAYTSITPLKNTANDADDMKAALEGLGFHVNMVKNGSLETMEAAVGRLGANLYRSPGSYGFFYYAGHGVQSGGENYLIPADAAVRTEARLRYEAVHLQYVLDELYAAGNALNLVVLDACRDNPFQWARSTARGLTVAGRQPPGSIIVYATSAGSTAPDGEGRNGVFTGELLKHLQTPGLEVKELFNRTAAGVQRASANRQTPAVYLQFFESAWLGAGPQEAAPPVQRQDWAPARDFDLSLEGNGLAITKYKGEGGAVNIPPRVDGIPITAIGKWAFGVFGEYSSLTSITIPNSVMAIGDFAFLGCDSLTSIVIPNSVTAIGVAAFAGCSSLTSIVIPASVTTIWDGAFYDCRSLTSITVEAGNKQYSSVNGILFSKDGKTLVCYPAGKVFTAYTIPASVTTIGEYIFSSCSSLTSITIPNSVTAIGNRAFAACDSLSATDREAIRRRFGDGVF